MLRPLFVGITVLLLLGLYEFVLFWIDGIAGYEATNWTRWVGLLTGAAAWPVVNGIYARLMRRQLPETFEPWGAPMTRGCDKSGGAYATEESV